MSEIETETNTETEANPPVVFHREVAFEISQDDGRTLEARIIPYDVEAVVADPPHNTPYREVFRHGAFAPQMAAANRVDVLLNYEHQQNLSGVIGRGKSLEDRPDGLYGQFRILEHPDGDKALQLVHDGVLRGMSAEFISKRSNRTFDGLVERTDARLRAVALCRDFDSVFVGAKAAYQGAEVLAVRHQMVLFEPVPDLNVERLKALGIRV